MRATSLRVRATACECGQRLASAGNELASAGNGLRVHTTTCECTQRACECGQRLASAHNDLRVHTTGLRVHTTGLRVRTTGLRVHTTGLRVHTTGLRVHTTGLRVHTTACERLGACQRRPRNSRPQRVVGSSDPSRFTMRALRLVLLGGTMRMPFACALMLASFALAGCPPAAAGTDAPTDAPTPRDSGPQCTPEGGDCAGSLQFSCCPGTSCLMESVGGMTVSRCAR